MSRVTRTRQLPAPRVRSARIESCLRCTRVPRLLSCLLCVRVVPPPLVFLSFWWFDPLCIACFVL